MVIYMVTTARLPIKAKPPKDGDAKPERLKPTKVFGQDRPANRKAKSGKPDDAKSWIYNHLYCDQDCQTAEEQIFFAGMTKRWVIPA